MNGPASLQHTLNLNKNLHSENTNLNVNVNIESNGYAGSDHYSEIDKAETSSPSSNLRSWPEDLQSSEAPTATYANVVSRGLPSIPAPPPPPIGPNESPTKPKNNFDIAQSLNELSLDAKNSSPKKLDPVFIAELEKHLGEKEATKNTNSTKYQSPQLQSKQQHHQQQPQSAATLSNIPLTNTAPAVSNKPLDNTVIPMLRPPPQSVKPKSPNFNETNGGSSFNFPNKVQNSWHSKSTNIQRPRSQLGASSQLTGEIGNTGLWQQNQLQTNSNPNVAAASASASASVSTTTSNSATATPPYSGNSFNTLPNVNNNAPSNLEVAAHNVAMAYHQQFPSLPSPSQLSLQNTQSPSAQNSSIVQRPASIAGSALSEQVYAELKQTVPNLDQLSQNEFNTLYNKTVRENILKSYQANSNALVTATNHVSNAYFNFLFKKFFTRKIFNLFILFCNLTGKGKQSDEPTSKNEHSTNASSRI